MVIPGFDVAEEISRSGWHALHRGQRLAGGEPVLLKLPVADAPQSPAIELLAHEFELLRSIALPGVPSVRDLVRRDGRTCLVLDDPGGLPLPLSLRAELPSVETFLALAARMIAVLGQVHRLGIVHGSIEPRAFLLHSVTGDVALVDFAHATSDGGGVGTPDTRYLLRRALAYLAPEQSGRTSRTVDQRADLYALGATWYELLTGRAPFRTDDPLELIHLHLAKTPASPTEIDPRIPEPIARIVLKLLAKTPEQRYQSAAGLALDVESCARDWAVHRRIAPFPLGRGDVSDRFAIPHALYGREADVDWLRSRIERARTGRPALLLVAGPPGIGKTALIQDLLRPALRERTHFVSGKFDQLARGVPYGALIHALRALVRQLLTENEAELARWRARLVEALGTNGGVVAEVIPEIDLIVGTQPPAPSVDPAARLNRFQLVFQRFASALAREDRPLVLFLDDLQWADPGTLSLLPTLLAAPDVRHLLVVGAFRDSEVDAAHPLTRTVESLESAGVEVGRLVLGPLPLSDLTRLVRDTLRGEHEEAAALAQLVASTTEGNPFFSIQFLNSLRQDGFLVFDPERGCFAYRSTRGGGGPSLAEDVVDLIARKLERLDPEAARLMTLASCIGHSFDDEVLSTIGERPLERVRESLGPAVRESLILAAARDDAPFAEAPTGYAFVHDRVQQAAYARIPADERPVVHRRIGRLLLERADAARLDDALFDVVHQLNLGCLAIESEAERVELARLDLRAGRKAQASTAFAAARTYFEAGASVLSDRAWDAEYELAFALRLGAAECLYLCGRFDEVERASNELLARARTRLDRARVEKLRSVQYENRSLYGEALAVARTSLRTFGVRLPEAEGDKRAALEREVETIRARLGPRGIRDLIDLPELTDPEIRMVLEILTDAWSSAYITGDAWLARLMSATIVRLSLEHGNSAESAYGYVTHTITVGPLLGDYGAAYEFGRLALTVNERFHDSMRRAKIHQQFHAHACFWREPFAACVPYAREACRAGLESGDFLYAVYGAVTEAWPALLASTDLGRFVTDYTPASSLIERLRVESFGDAHRVLLGWARALRGETLAPLSLSSGDFDEDAYRATYRDNPFFSMFAATARLHLCYTLEAYDAALDAARTTRAIGHHLEGTMWPVLAELWTALTWAAVDARLDEAARREGRRALEDAERTFATLALSCPANFKSAWLLLSAERARVTGDPQAAIERYEQAVEAARESGLAQQIGPANELAGRFWLDRGGAQVGALLLREARDAYLRWGALAKVRALEERYGERLGPTPSHEPRTPAASTAPTDAAPLDLFSVMKAAQAIAGEIELDRLLAQLMRITLENAGAERGALILEVDGQPFVVAEGAVDAPEPTGTTPVPLDRAERLPLSLVYYVRRTAESVVLDDASADSTYGTDPDVVHRKPRSVMAVPVLHQARRIGVLYLENNTAARAFTEDRILICRLLASQAAVALENARLYDEMRQEALLRRQTEETLRSIVEGTAAVTGGDFFASLVQHLAQAFQVRYAFITECSESRTHARTLAFWRGDRLSDNVEYDVTETPCRNVLAGQVCHYPSGVQRLFPRDRDLVDLMAEGYLGIPVPDRTGAPIGHIAVLDDKPLELSPQALSLLTIFAARAGAELERERAEQKLRVALAEVEQLKNRLQAENVYLQEEILREHNFEEVVGTSPSLLDVLRKLERVAPTDATVLITGETGTGKELIARALHDRSARRSRPLVKVSCGAIPAGLVESELFGHVKGAFTGALDRRVGRFELADGGTLFLDEVGELPPETQVKLLRVLQEREFEPVGSNRTVRVDVRLIAATNRDLEREAAEGRFRSDLYYRLNVVPLAVPPLRERTGDVPLLVSFFVDRFAKRLGKPITSVSSETMRRLTEYGWPGNVRELQNVIERAVVLSSGPSLDLDFDLAGKGPARTQTVAAPEPQGSGAALVDMERRHILEVLAQTKGVIEGPDGAARILALHPSTLRSRMKKLGIGRPTHEIS